MPAARLCVICLQTIGDVPLLKRLDETIGDNEKIETYFYDDPSFERYIAHTNRRVANQQCFDIAVGDDSHLFKDIGTSVDIARSLSTEFEDDDIPSEGLVGRPITLPTYSQVAA